MLDFLIVSLAIITILIIWLVFYRTIVWVRGLVRRRIVNDKISIAIDDISKENHFERIILQANEYLFPCLQQMKWGKAQSDRSFLPAVKELLRRDNLLLPHSIEGLGNFQIIAWSAAYAFEIVKSKESNNMEMQALYAKEVIKGVIRMKGLSFFNKSLIEICEYFKTYPFGRY